MGPLCSRWAPAITNSQQSEGVARGVPLYNLLYSRKLGENLATGTGKRFMKERGESGRFVGTFRD
jgi:hypothetical protein